MKREKKIKTIVTLLRFASLVVVGLASASVFALVNVPGGGCALDANGDCIVMEVVASGGGGSAGGTGAGSGGGTIYLPSPPPEVGGGGTAAAGTTTEKVIALLKAGQCKKASEDCVTWGQRMTTPLGAPTPNGQSTGTGFCQTVSVGLLGVATAICTNVVNLEVNAEMCVNISCPQV